MTTQLLPSVPFQPGLRPVTELIQQARQGVARRRVDEVARLVDLTDKEMARVLNISVRGLHAKTPAEPLSLAASERLLLLERLVQHGLTVFDGRTDLLARWLRTPLAELAYSSPFSAPTKASAQNRPAPVSVRDMGRFDEPDPSAARNASGDAGADADQLWANSFQSPLAVLDTVSGFSLADDVLGRIEWGIVG
jgi:uncharacterized protein (DUF2384 family)